MPQTLIFTIITDWIFEIIISVGKVHGLGWKINRFLWNLRMK